MRRFERIGMQHGEWTVVGVDSERKHNVLCRCSCGTDRSITVQNLKNGITQSCGCNSVKKYRAFGEEKTLPDWASDERCAVGYNTLRDRLKKGWSEEDAISTPPYGAPSAAVFRGTSTSSDKKSVQWDVEYTHTSKGIDVEIPIPEEVRVILSQKLEEHLSGVELDHAKRRLAIQLKEGAISSRISFRIEVDTESSGLQGRIVIF